jgi:hypothetical protein
VWWNQADGIAVCHDVVTSAKIFEISDYDTIIGEDGFPMEDWS